MLLIRVVGQVSSGLLTFNISWRSVWICVPGPFDAAGAASWGPDWGMPAALYFTVAQHVYAAICALVAGYPNNQRWLAVIVVPVWGQVLQVAKQFDRFTSVQDAAIGG